MVKDTDKEFGESMLKLMNEIRKDNKTDAGFRSMYLISIIIEILIKKFFGVSR